MSLASRLKEAREDKGWKKVDLKREAKLRSASTLTELENGTIEESPQIPAIADALGVEVQWLKYGKGQKHRPIAKDIQLSEAAFKAAMIINAMPPERQDAWLHLLGIESVVQEGEKLIESRTPTGVKKLAASQ